jgi:hypothetical protein
MCMHWIVVLVQIRIVIIYTGGVGNSVGAGGGEDPK